MSFPYIIDENNTQSTFFIVNGTPKNSTNKYEEINRPGFNGMTLLYTGNKPNDAQLNVEMNFTTSQERMNFINYIQNKVLHLLTYYDSYSNVYNIRLMDVNINREWQVFKPIGGGGYWLEFEMTVRMVNI